MNPRESHLAERKGKRIVLFPFPFQGHINPMLQLANILYSKGFCISIIHTEYNSPTPSDYPYFAFHSISDCLNLKEKTQASVSDVIALVIFLNAECLVPFRNRLAKLLTSSEEPIACLIADAVWYFSQSVVDSLGIPRIVLRPSSVCSFLAWEAFPFLSDKGYLRRQESQLEEPVTELPPLRVKDLPLIKTGNSDNFYEFIFNMVKETKSSSGLIWNTFQDLEQSALVTCRQHFPIPVFAIGPFHKHFPSASSSSSSSLLKQDQSAISWLNSQAPNSVIYVSFGSVHTISTVEFLELAWGLANSQQPFLWVVRPGFIRGSEWLEPLPNGFLENLCGRGHIVKWAPQLEVLRHSAVAGFLTHNGWNSTIESICEGVPMICSPCAGDQLVNARYVSDVWRVGVRLEGKLERGEIERAIKKLLNERKDVKERIMNLNMKADQALRVGGSSFQSLECLVNYILSF